MWGVWLIFFLIAAFTWGQAIVGLFIGKPELSIALGIISIATVSLGKFLKDDVGGFKKSE